MKTNSPNQSPEPAALTSDNSVADKEYHTVMVHFYRGELGRIMIWRQRLDVTTNWSIVGATALITFSLGSPEHTQLALLLANFLVFLLLSIESRRYRYYDAFRARVRMLEAHFIMPVLMQSESLLKGDWRRIMSEDLLLPSFKISKWTAILRRFRRNYIWIFLLIFLAWISKIWLHFPHSENLESFVEIVVKQSEIPAPIFWTTVTLSYAAISALAVASLFLKNDSGEFSRGAMRRKKWLI